MWPSAVAASDVLSDEVVIDPLQIATDTIKRVPGQHLTSNVVYSAGVVL